MAGPGGRRVGDSRATLGGLFRLARRHKVITALLLLFFIGVANQGDKNKPADSLTADTLPPAAITAPVVTPTSPEPTEPSPTPSPTASPSPTPTPTPTPTPSPTPVPTLASEPQAGLTPGHVFAGVTRTRLCVSGYSSSVRNVTSSTREAVFAAYGIAYPPKSGAYELDHLIPLDLGGDNTAENLWPEPYHGKGSADLKDHLENHLHALVCSGQVALSTAQRAIAGDWTAAAAKYNKIEVRQPTTRPAPRPAPRPTTPPPATGGGSTYYVNCTAVKAAGAAPIHVGEPGYSRKLDRDGDGVACE